MNYRHYLAFTQTYHGAICYHINVDFFLSRTEIISLMYEKVDLMIDLFIKLNCKRYVWSLFGLMAMHYNWQISFNDINERLSSKWHSRISF